MSRCSSSSTIPCGSSAAASAGSALASSRSRRRLLPRRTLRAVWVAARYRHGRAYAASGSWLRWYERKTSWATSSASCWFASTRLAIATTLGYSAVNSCSKASGRRLPVRRRASDDASSRDVAGMRLIVAASASMTYEHHGWFDCDTGLLCRAAEMGPPSKAPASVVRGMGRCRWVIVLLGCISVAGCGASTPTPPSTASLPADSRIYYPGSMVLSVHQINLAESVVGLRAPAGVAESTFLSWYKTKIAAHGWNASYVAEHLVVADAVNQ